MSRALGLTTLTVAGVLLTVVSNEARQTVPDQYRDFQAPANRVESIVQLIHAGQ